MRVCVFCARAYEKPARCCTPTLLLCVCVHVHVCVCVCVCGRVTLRVQVLWLATSRLVSRGLDCRTIRHKQHCKSGQKCKSTPVTLNVPLVKTATAFVNSFIRWRHFSSRRYECVCPDDGHTYDAHCRVVLPCDSSPCAEGATCVNHVHNASFSCACAAGWAGPLCGVRVSRCERQGALCVNGGSCISASDGKRHACVLHEIIPDFYWKSTSPSQVSLTATGR